MHEISSTSADCCSVQRARVVKKKNLLINVKYKQSIQYFISLIIITVGLSLRIVITSSDDEMSD